MSRSRSILAWLLPVVCAASLSACDTPTPSSGDAKADAAVLQACRQRANEVYDRRNRAEIYAPQYGGNSPLSGGYTDVGINRGLSAQFSFEQMVRDCVRQSNVSGERAIGTTPASAPATSPTSTSSTSTSPIPLGLPASGGGAPRAGTALPPPGLIAPPGGGSSR